MNGPVILLVEDNPDDEELTRLTFARNDLKHSLVVAHDGVEALDYLFGTGDFAGRDATVTPDIVLLDLKLPKVDGLEVLRRLRQDARTQHVPVVVLSTSRERRDILASYALGANGYVRKPVDFAQFTDVMELVGRYWLTVNEYPVQRRRE